MAASLLLAGCAGVVVHPTTGPYDTTTEGFRLPERKPLVVLFGSNVSVLWVCNPNKSTAMEFGAFAAKHKFKMNFDSCGAPQNIDSDIDSTDVPTALIGLLQDLGGKYLTQPPPGAGTAGIQQQSGGVSAFQVFDVRFAPDDSIALVPLVDPHDILYVKVPSAPATIQTTPTPPPTPTTPPPPTTGAH